MVRSQVRLLVGRPSNDSGQYGWQHADGMVRIYTRPSGNSSSRRSPLVITLHPRFHAKSSSTSTPTTAEAPRERRVWTDRPLSYQSTSYSNCDSEPSRRPAGPMASPASVPRRRGSDSSDVSTASSTSSIDSHYSYGSRPIKYSADSPSNGYAYRRRGSSSSSSDPEVGVILPLPLPPPPPSAMDDTASLSSDGSVDWAALVRKEREREWTKRRRVRFADA